jgi:phenylacetic acid degradation operon negative regulatory protein
MRASTEEWLYVLLWTADSLLRPSWRSALDPGGFESWAWRNGLGRRVADLERRKLIERQPESSDARIVRLTDSGRLSALGGRDPAERWNRSWDGRWRLVLFDIPKNKPALRCRLWRRLRAERFGCLQGSVWLTPDSMSEARRIAGGAPENPEGLILFEGRPVGGETDSAIVRGAWDFDAINRRYRDHLEIARVGPPRGPRSPEGFARVWSWARREQQAWTAALRLDPLLPTILLPDGYLGRQAWQARREVIVRVAGMLA